MSKSLSVVSNGSAVTSQLVSFATNLIGKATKNAVSAKTVPSATSHAVVVGTESIPAGVVTSVTKVKGTGIYSGVTSTFIRSILPRDHSEAVSLRDSLDVYRGADLSKENAAAEAAIKKSAATVVEAAKASGSKKVTLMLKQQSTFEGINQIFTDVAKEVIEGAGLTVEVLPTAAVTNTLIMFPEELPIIFTNDVPQAELVEKVFSGIVGNGAVTEFITSEGNKIYGGHSSTSVAAAIASALSDMGYSAEATAVTKAVTGGKSENDILAAL